MADNFSQARLRNHTKFTDQHGRKWEGPVEMKSMHPCGPVTPIDWEPPHPSLMPDQSYIKPVKGEAGQLVIQYDEWIQRIREAQVTWDQQADYYAHATYGDKAHEVIAKPTPALLKYCGQKPPAIEPILAMREGNKWALGFPGYKIPALLETWWAAMQKRDAELARFLPGAVEERLFPDEPDEDLEGRLDLEEQYDPDAQGGKRVQRKRAATLT